MVRKFVVLIVLCLVGLFLDLGTKYLFYNQEIGSSLSFLHPVFNLGVSWSLPISSLISITVAFLAFCFFIFFYWKQYISFWIALLLIVGTLGNMIDRIIFGGVRDFLFLFDWFPIFNLADVFLTMGIAFYFWIELFTGKNKKK